MMQCWRNKQWLSTLGPLSMVRDHRQQEPSPGHPRSRSSPRWCRNVVLTLHHRLRYHWNTKYMTVSINIIWRVQSLRHSILPHPHPALFWLNSFLVCLLPLLNVSSVNGERKQEYKFHTGQLKKLANNVKRRYSLKFLLTCIPYLCSVCVGGGG